MNFFAPERRRIADRPTYANGKAVLPHLVIDPTESGDWTVAVLAVGPDGGAYWLHRDLTFGELMNFLDAWREDPEAVLADLGWQRPREPTRAAQRPHQGLTLEDLED